MNEEKSIVEEIYAAPAEDLPGLGAKAINDATRLLGDYAKKIVKKSDVFKNRWILVNLLNVLYKDIFLLQTEDLNDIVKSNPKSLDKNLSDKCNLCNKELSCTLEVKGVKDEERTRGVCLDCFISTVKEGDWWDEARVRLEDEVKK